MPKTKAFTLIQLLFVIAIIAIIASLEISLQQKKTSNFKIHQTAIQMQQILQAAINYKNINGNWPSNGNTKTIDQRAPFFAFLPATPTTNPWNSDTYSFQSGIGEFSVTTDVKSNSLGEQIAALLPYGTNNNGKITTYLAAPPNKNKKQLSVNDQTVKPPKIDSIGIAQDGDNLHSSCPNPQYFMALNSFVKYRPIDEPMMFTPIKDLYFSATQNIFNSRFSQVTYVGPPDYVKITNITSSPSIFRGARALVIATCGS